MVQWLSDVLQKQVHTIGMPDISALGAAYLAGLKAGVFENIEALKKLNNLNKEHQNGIMLETKELQQVKLLVVYSCQNLLVKHTLKNLILKILNTKTQKD